MVETTQQQQQQAALDPHLIRPIKEQQIDRGTINWDHLKQSLRHFEGPVHKQIYHDETKNHYKSIGLHHILQNEEEEIKYKNGISDQEIETLLDQDIQRCIFDCREWLGERVFDKLDPIRREAILHLRFGLGFKELNSGSYDQFKFFLQRFEFQNAAKQFQNLPLAEKFNQERIRFLLNAFQDGLF